MNVLRDASDDSSALLGTIGLIVDSGHHAAALINGAANAAKDAGYRLLLGNASGARIEEDRQLDKMSRMSVDGILYAPAARADADPPHWERIGELPVPIVLIESPALPTSVRVDAVSTDHRYGTFLGIEHLADNGYERIGILRTDAAPGCVIEAGYLDAIAALGLPGGMPCSVIAEAESLTVRRAIADDFIDDCLERSVRAALVATEEIAALVAMRLQERDLRIPDDFALVSYGDDAAAIGTVPLTAVASPAGAVGREAVELCLARLTTQTAIPPRRVQLLPNLRARDSSRATLARAAFARR